MVALFHFDIAEPQPPAINKPRPEQLHRRRAKTFASGQQRLGFEALVFDGLCNLKIHPGPPVRKCSQRKAEIVPILRTIETLQRRFAVLRFILDRRQPFFGLPAHLAQQPAELFQLSNSGIRLTYPVDKRPYVISHPSKLFWFRLQFELVQKLLRLGKRVARRHAQRPNTYYAQEHQPDRQEAKGVESNLRHHRTSSSACISLAN